MKNPMVLFDENHRTDPAIHYDFNLLPFFDQKKNFVKKVFEEGCIEVERHVPNSYKQLFVCYLHKLYLERVKVIIDGLKGTMTLVRLDFREFSDFFIGCEKANPMTLFDDDDQFHPSIIYDFDLLASDDQKKSFIEKVFEEERILCRCFIGD